MLSDPPRIAALWADLDPSAGGTVTAKASGPDFVVSFTDVPEFGGDGSNTFAVTLSPDGSFKIVYSAISTTAALVGRSKGDRTLDPGEIDLSTTAQSLGAPNIEILYEHFTGNGADDVDLANSTLAFAPYSDRKAFVLLSKMMNFSRFAKVEGDAHSNRDIHFYEGRPSVLAGDVTAVRNILLSTNNTIKGDVTAGGTITLAGGTFTGTVTSGAAVAAIPLPTLGFGPFSGPDLVVPASGKETALPGTYNVVH